MTKRMLDEDILSIEYVDHIIKILEIAYPDQTTLYLTYMYDNVDSWINTLTVSHNIRKELGDADFEKDIFFCFTSLLCIFL
jgi:hypothetical protein